MNNRFFNFFIKNTVCPACLSPLNYHVCEIKCTNISCNKIYPIINSIPILIDSTKSLFKINDFLDQKNTFFKYNGRKLYYFEKIKKILPSISINVCARKNLKGLSKLLLRNNKVSNILIIGSGIAGDGIEYIINNKNFVVIESDVSFGLNTSIIADCHNIPFKDCTFDAVICQAVLEHVIDPKLCVSEIYRVLNNNGLVYSETPFIQQVHGGIYDFTRFTFRGHRNLFRNFDEIDAGLTGGPGMAFAWSFTYLLLSFSFGKYSRIFLKIISILLVSPFKYLDYFLIKFPNSKDAASGFYFLGKKSNVNITKQESSFY